jgi:aryl-alcohol dehydrogenase-like predicted oxidoreductase
MLEKQHYRSLGTSGIAVSPLGVGTNRWEQGKNDEVISQVVQSCLEAGVNFFDSAEVYNSGRSERLLGTCIKQKRQSVVIASKITPAPTRLSHRYFMSRRHFINILDASLSRLGVQYIDLYYIHWPFTFLSVETLMDMMAHAVEIGKIRAVGVSNFNAVQMRRAATRLARYNIPLAANQVHYSLLHRQPETDGVLDVCRELDVALVAYCPLERGWFQSSSISETPSRLSSSASEKLKQQEVLRQTLHTIAHKHGKSVNQVVLNWLLCKDKHVIPIPGATNALHALENADTLTWKLSDEEYAMLDQASSFLSLTL